MTNIRYSLNSLKNACENVRYTSSNRGFYQKCEKFISEFEQVMEIPCSDGSNPRIDDKETVDFLERLKDFLNTNELFDATSTERFKTVIKRRGCKCPKGPPCPTDNLITSFLESLT